MIIAALLASAFTHSLILANQDNSGKGTSIYYDVGDEKSRINVGNVMTNRRPIYSGPIIWCRNAY